MPNERSELEYRLDDLEAMVDDLPEVIEERLERRFNALEASLREDITSAEVSLEVYIDNWFKSLKARRRS
jgi:hypothetical protein